MKEDETETEVRQRCEAGAVTSDCDEGSRSRIRKVTEGHAQSEDKQRMVQK